jgi:hypothetical protein
MRPHHIVGIALAIVPSLVLPFTPIPFWWRFGIAGALALVAIFLLLTGRFPVREFEEPIDQPNLRTATGFPEKDGSAQTEHDD